MFYFDDGNKRVTMLFNKGIEVSESISPGVGVVDGNDESFIARLKQLRDAVPTSLKKLKRVQLFINPPACNKNCDYCITKRINWEGETTSPETLDYMLNLCEEGGIKADIVFTMREPLMEQYIPWQKEIVDVLVAHKDNITSEWILTNGVDINSTVKHPFIEMADVFPKLKVFITANANPKAAKNNHSTIRELEYKFDVLSRKNVGTICMPILFVGTENELYSPKQAEFIKHLDVQLRPMYVLGDGVNPEIAKQNILNWVKEFNHAEYWTTDRLNGLFSLAFGDIDYDWGGAPRFVVCKEGLMKGVTTNQDCVPKDAEEFFKYIFELHINEYPKFEEGCTLCKAEFSEGSCLSKIKSGGCPIKIKDTCTKCPLFGTCSGFLDSSCALDTTCDAEVYSILFLYAAAVSSMKEYTSEEFKKIVKMDLFQDWRGSFE